MEENKKIYISEDTLSKTLNNSFSEYVQLASYTRIDTTTQPKAENFTLTFSEPLSNFAMVFIAVRVNAYIVGSSLVPVQFFKLGYPFELNCLNDLGTSYHGNLKYINDTSASGKISGYTTGFDVYGFLRIT